MLDAAKGNAVDVVKARLEEGVSVNIRDGAGNTALTWAAFEGHMETIRELLKAGADVNLPDTYPLHNAACLPQIDALHLLLKAGAKVNVQDKDGRTALHDAAENGRTEAVRELLKAGADANLKMKNGKTPADLAKVDEIRRLLQ